MPSHDPTLPTSNHKPQQPTSKADVTAAIGAVHSQRAQWKQSTLQQRQGLLQQCLQRLEDNMTPFAEESVARKGSAGNGLGEEMMLCAPIATALQEMALALKANGQPAALKTSEPNGRKVCNVWPAGLNKLAWLGAKADVWMQRDQPVTQGRIYRDGTATEQLPGICGILAAGNHLAVPVRNAMQQMFCDHNLTVIKMNPVNDWMGSQLERIFEPLIAANFMRIIYGGADVAKMLMADERVTALHMTGSRAVYNKIVWGDKPPGAGQPVLGKPFTAELGCITPVIVVPSRARWSAKDLRAAAVNAVIGAVTNSGHNCNATELIITARKWPQRGAFLNACRDVLNECHQRWPWYPGSREKHEAFQQRFPDAEELGKGGMCNAQACTKPFLFATGLSPEQAQTQEETWGPCLQEVALDVGIQDGNVDVEHFVRDAVDFCNNSVYGTLSCGLVVHPSVDKRHKETIQIAVERLCYGMVAVNLPPLISFAMTSAPWGAWAAAGTAQDIGSGNVLEATTMYDHTEKAVVRFPFKPMPKSFWDPSFKNLEGMMPAYVRFVSRPGVGTLTQLVQEALKG